MSERTIQATTLALLSAFVFVSSCGQRNGTSGDDLSRLFNRLANYIVVVQVHLTHTDQQYFENPNDSDDWRIDEKTKRIEQPVTTGSGIIVSDGRIVTNCHVIAPGTEISVVVADGVKMDAQLEAADFERDLCLLSAPVVRTAALEIRELDSLIVGERVVAIGSPAGLSQSLSEGLISGLRTENQTRLVQTTAAISPGSSGGGLFDLKGRLIGITTFKIQETEQVNFALPAVWIDEIAERAEQHSKIADVASAAYAETCNRELTRYMAFRFQCNLDAMGGSIRRVLECEENLNRRYADSIVAGTKWTKADPWSASAWSCLASAASNDREHNIAVDAAEHMVELRPLPHNLVDAADVYLKRGSGEDLLRAREYLERAIAADPEYDQAWSSLASAFFSMNDLQRAIEAASRAAELDPSSRDYANYLKFYRSKLTY